MVLAEDTQTQWECGNDSMDDSMDTEVTNVPETQHVFVENTEESVEESVTQDCFVYPETQCTESGNTDRIFNTITRHTNRHRHRHCTDTVFFYFTAKLGSF